MISSINNKKIKEYTKLHQKKYRLKQRKFLVFEHDLILKYIPFFEIVYGIEDLNYPNYEMVSKQVLEKLSKRNDISLIGICNFIENKEIEAEKIIILDDVNDPRNIGLILSSMDFFDFNLLVYSENCADFYQEKVIQEAKESFFKIIFIKKQLLDYLKQLKKQGYNIYSTGLNNESIELSDLEYKKPFVLVLGNEGHGVRKEIMDISDEVIKIDMNNLDSLNVAMAGSIAMSYLSK